MRRRHPGSQDAGLFQGGTHTRVVLLREPGQRKPYPYPTEPQRDRPPFYRDRIGLHEQVPMQCGETLIQRAGTGPIARERGLTHRLHEARRQIGRHRDHPIATQQQKVAGGGVIATVEGESLPTGRAQDRTA